VKHVFYQYFKTARQKTLVETASFNYVNLSLDSIGAYARKYGYERRFESKTIVPFSEFYGIFLPFLEGWCWDYDSICFVDCDIMASTEAENIYDYVSMDTINAYVQPSLSMVAHETDSRFEFYRQKMGGWVNSGVVVFPKSIYSDLIYFLKDLPEYFEMRMQTYPMSIGFFDQFVVNEFIRLNGSWNALPEKFNYIHGHPDVWHQIKEEEAQLHHYHRKSKEKMLQAFESGKILK
jgi:hypothetical protein